MKAIFKIFAAGAIVLSLSACVATSDITSAVSSLTQVQVTPEAVVLASSAFDASKVTATNYLRLRKCDGTNGPVCRDPVLTVKVNQAVQSGTIARNGLKAFARANPGVLGPSGLYNALTGATATLKASLAAYEAAK